MSQREAADQASDREHSEDEPGLQPVMAERGDDADLHCGDCADERDLVTVASSTGRFRTTRPNARRLRGMRTRPSSGERTIQPPPRVRMIETRSSPSTVPTCVETNVMTTGARIQMISRSEASRENSGVSCEELTTFG